MTHLNPAVPVVVLALALCPETVLHGNEGSDAAPADPDNVADRGFRWLCFASSIAAVGGMYVFVRRREQAVEADRKRSRGKESAWYCRACARDATGLECPRCRAANPFLRDGSAKF
jgi:hypothetical protein